MNSILSTTLRTFIGVVVCTIGVLGALFFHAERAAAIPPLQYSGPIVYAGVDRTVVLADTNLLTLGPPGEPAVEGVPDPEWGLDEGDNPILIPSVTYSWSQVSGPVEPSPIEGHGSHAWIADIYNGDTLTPQFGFAKDGTYTFELIAYDVEGRSDSDIMEVVVSDVPQPPVLSAGIDLTTSSTPGSASTNGASLSDPGGVNPSVSWEFVSGPTLPQGAPTPIATPNGGGDPGALFENLTTPGDYVFRMFTCCYPGDVEDFMTVTVTDPGVPPTVDAGNDIQTMAPGFTPIEGYSASSQFAAAFDSDGTIQSIDWTFVSGPYGEAPIITAQVDDPYGADFSGMYSGGVYTFRMTATDSDGLEAYDDMTVTICRTNLGLEKGGEGGGGCAATPNVGDLSSDIIPTVNGTLAQGQSVTFNGRVRNAGDIDISDSFWTKFRYKWENQPWTQLGDQIHKADILPLSSGASDDDTSDSFTLSAQGTLLISYCVDSLADITESDENNNCMTETFTVQEPLPPCDATTINHCELGSTAVGDTDGQCAVGYSGICNYACESNAGVSSWSQNSNSCSNAPTGDIVADSESIIAGQTVTLTWTSSNASSCTVSPTGWTGTSESTGETDTPFVTTIYALTCDGVLVDAVTVDVNSTGMQPVLSSLGGQYVARGSAVTLSWDTNNFALGGESLCTLTGGGITGSELQNATGDSETGSVDVTVDARTTFTLTCPTGVAEYIVEVIPEGIEI